MTNEGRRLAWLIRCLMPDIPLPEADADKWLLFRALVNVRQPGPVSREFLSVQNALLKQALEEKGIVNAEDLQPVRDNLYLWKGDITTLKADAVVNAANSGMTGCYCPNHGCIDNAIHTYAGVQLRNECARIMDAQGYSEPVGQVKITEAYNLPCRYILHTVGPTVRGSLTELHERQLANCYCACIEAAAAHGFESIAFCCISTGEFRFPHERAAQIAIDTVRGADTSIKVIFDVFSDEDYRLYASKMK